MEKLHTQAGKAVYLLSPLITQARKSKITSVVSSRTRSIAVLLENVSDQGNKNAVIRSMDAFGVLSMHSVQTLHSPKPSDRTVRTDAGAHNWVKVYNWKNIADCLTTLKGNGYMIACACPDSTIGISDVNFCKKTVIAFGNEGNGVSDYLAGVSDIKFALPMCGFVESLNISVSVAITLYHAYSQRMETLGTNGDLSEEDKIELTLQYYMKSCGISEQQLFHLMNTHT